MSIVVTKCSPVIVVPAELGTSTCNIHLSSFDMAMGCVPVSSLLVFDKPIDDPVETIRCALSRALVHYSPISGRLAAGADGGEVITCTGEGQGVLLVSASASCAVDGMSGLLNNLFVHYPDELCCRHADPLLLIQVTEFSCGGFVVGVTWNHALADAAGMGQFLQAVGELARGLSMPSVVPVRSDESVLAARPQGMSVADYFSSEPTDDLAFLDFTIPSSLINHVKAEVSFALGERCTVFEVVVALVWQCHARAVAADSPATLVFSCNLRGLVGAAGGYYGNCAMEESVQATSAQVANGATKDVVKLIKSVKQKVVDHIKNGGEVDRAQRQLGYSTLVVSSWRNLGLEAADFGSGRPARVMWFAEQASVPCCVLCPPHNVKDDDGVNVLGYIVKKGHVDAFLQELAALAPGCCKRFDE